jgi:hypothetical protein
LKSLFIQNQKKMARTANETERLNEVEKSLQKIAIEAGNLKHLIPLLAQNDERLFKAHMYEGSLFLIQRRSAAMLETVNTLKQFIYE